MDENNEPTIIDRLPLRRDTKGKMRYWDSKYDVSFGDSIPKGLFSTDEIFDQVRGSFQFMLGMKIGMVVHFEKRVTLEAARVKEKDHLPHQES